MTLNEAKAQNCCRYCGESLQDHHALVIWRNGAEEHCHTWCYEPPTEMTHKAWLEHRAMIAAFSTYGEDDRVLHPGRKS